jgi:Glycosyltransferases involved in cell wall biogenesis
MDTLYIVIPAYNEVMNIESVAKEWHETVQKAGPDSRLVIIDDGSRDNTYSVLNNLKQELPQLEPVTKSNEGHGATVLFGYKYALVHNADYIFQTDSDGQTLASEFDAFWEDRKNYSAIIGYRKHREDGFSRIIVTKVLKLVLLAIFGVQVPDANTPYRLMSNAILTKYISKIPEKFNLSNVVLTVLLIRNKESVRFIPITFRPRQGGINSINFKKILKIGKQAVRDFKRIKKEIKAS